MSKVITIFIVVAFCVTWFVYKSDKNVNKPNPANISLAEPVTQKTTVSEEPTHGTDREPGGDKSIGRETSPNTSE